MGKNKSRINRPKEPLEDVIYGALMYCLFMCGEYTETEARNICEWCIPKLEFMPSDLLEAILKESNVRKKKSEAWAELIRVVILTLDYRKAGEQAKEAEEAEDEETEGEREETDEMCVQASPVSEET